MQIYAVWHPQCANGCSAASLIFAYNSRKEQRGTAKTAPKNKFLEFFRDRGEAVLVSCVAVNQLASMHLLMQRKGGQVGIDACSLHGI
jgi:hypothetical protein